MIARSEESSMRAATRFSSSYETAKNVIKIGVFVRIGSQVLAWLLVAVALLAFVLKVEDDRAVYGEIGAAAIRLLIFGYIAGRLISAFGEYMTTNVDGVVQSSPFLSEGQKMKLMRLE